MNHSVVLEILILVNSKIERKSEGGHEITFTGHDSHFSVSVIFFSVIPCRASGYHDLGFVSTWGRCKGVHMYTSSKSEGMIILHIISYNSHSRNYISQILH